MVIQTCDTGTGIITYTKTTDQRPETGPHFTETQFTTQLAGTIDQWEKDGLSINVWEQTG